MKYGSVCSGVEAATLAWADLGWKAAFFSEIEEFPRAVLQAHWPEVPLHGDFTTIGEKDYGSIDLLVGGTPCQSFSVAGLREGMGDERGVLALEYLKLAKRKRPQWLVWENVPGVLSANEGRDFGSLLGGMVELGYGFAYRVLDAKNFGVPQRRRRVFVVGYLGDWRPATAVLFERQSLSGDFKSRGKKKEKFTCKATAGSHWDDPANPHPTLNQSHNTGGIGASNQEVFSQRGGGLVSAHRMVAFGEYATDETASTIKARDAKDATDLVVHGTQDPCTSQQAFSVGRNQGGENCYLTPELQVRRLMPVECERLQGMPDNHTRIEWKGRPASECPDGHRYKAIGNSMAVPVMRMIGQRIDQVNRLLSVTKAA